MADDAQTVRCSHRAVNGAPCLMDPGQHIHYVEEATAFEPADWDKLVERLGVTSVVRLESPPRIPIPTTGTLVTDGIEQVVAGMERLAAWMYATACLIELPCQCCPVCRGVGRVPRDTYGETMNGSRLIICQSCSGAGFVWRPRG